MVRWYDWHGERDDGTSCRASSPYSEPLFSIHKFTKGVCNKGGFKIQDSMETGLQSPLLQTPFGKPRSILAAWEAFLCLLAGDSPCQGRPCQSRRTCPVWCLQHGAAGNPGLSKWRSRAAFLGVLRPPWHTSKCREGASSVTPCQSVLSVEEKPLGSLGGRRIREQKRGLCIQAERWLVEGQSVSAFRMPWRSFGFGVSKNLGPFLGVPLQQEPHNFRA